jgi:orotate phosphoribosyltransferase
MTATLSAPPLLAHLGDPWRIADLLDTPNTVCTGHFRLLGGQHSDRFVRFSQLAQDSNALDYVADLLTSKTAAWSPDGIVAPCTAGVALGVEVARRLGVRLHLASVGVDGRADGIIGAPPHAGAALVVVNDVVTTGEGLGALAAVVRGAQAGVAGAAVFLCRRAEVPKDVIGAPVAVVATVPLSSWSASDCPLCCANEPVTDGRDLN